jgi:hypothetical protein
MDKLIEQITQLKDADKKYLSEILDYSLANAANIKLIRNKVVENIINQAGYKSVNELIHEIKTAKLTLPPPFSTHYANFTDELIPYLEAALACDEKTAVLILDYFNERRLILKTGDNKYRYKL